MGTAECSVTPSLLLKVLPQCRELSQPQPVPPSEELQWGARSMPWGHRDPLMGITARTGCPKQSPFLGQGFNGVLGLHHPPLVRWVKASLPGLSHC